MSLFGLAMKPPARHEPWLRPVVRSFELSEVQQDSAPKMKMAMDL
jgi:hypothetical protein